LIPQATSERGYHAVERAGIRPFPSIFNAR
jgi:hypothetical protein